VFYKKGFSFIRFLFILIEELNGMIDAVHCVIMVSHEITSKYKANKKEKKLISRCFLSFLGIFMEMLGK